MLKKLESKEFFLVLVYIASFALFLPILNSPIHGDDLIAPFSYYYEYNGSILSYVRDFSFAIDGHINFLGELISIIWLDIWITALTNFDDIGLYINVYRTTKLLVVMIFLGIAIKINQKTSPRTPNNELVICILLSFLIVTVYHTNWSSDPVGNYPLTGYMSASIAGLYILLLRSYKFNRYLGFHFLYILFAIFFYELNVALFAVMIYHFRKSLNRVVFKLLILLTVTLGIFLYVYVTPPNAYDGGIISFNFLAIRTFFLQVTSVLPFATFPLAVYFSKLTLISSVAFIIIAVIFFSHLKNQTLSSNSKTFNLKKFFKLFSITHSEKLILIYFLSSCIILATSKKYQSEIIYPGQVYMTFSSGQLFLVVLLSRLLITQRIFYSIKKMILVSLLALSISFQNYLMVSVLETRTSFSQVILKSWDQNESYRCLSLDNFNTYRLDQDYMQRFTKSFLKMYYDVKGTPYCRNAIINE